MKRWKTSEIYDPEENAFIPGPALPYESEYSCALEVPGQPGSFKTKAHHLPYKSA